MLEEIVGEVTIDPALIEPDPNLRPKAPGMKYTHYAPKGELTIVESASNASTKGANKVITKINQLVLEKAGSGFKVAVITTSENANLFDCENILVAGDREKGETIAAKLYQVLRQCDELDVDYIYSEAFNDGELGGAIMNRLLKAAGHRVIKV